MQGSMAEFEKITCAEDYFEFFNIKYDEEILRTSRYLIMRLFGNLVKEFTAIDDEQRLSFYRFTFLQAYGDFVNGTNPSAEEIWNLYENGGGCSCGTSTCSTTKGCSTKAENI
ncbi:MAG: nitrogenase-stabilizing/protective protein NifW [Candidatus Marinarcus sp.]|uniref:nitrogenase-stabilizing/protective protein NifW n=1 Tax=Candidatus Marinarcus sp. TaxID=3100987 RepID=UPI003B0095B5